MMFSKSGQQDVKHVTFGILYELKEDNEKLILSFIPEIEARLNQQGYKSTKATILSSIKNINDLLDYKKFINKPLEDIVSFIESEIQVEKHYSKPFAEFTHGSMLMVFQVQ